MGTLIAATENRLGALLEIGGPEIELRGGEVLFAGRTARDITAEFGSPLYLYSERILRKRCREVAGMMDYRPFVPSYSCKANGNVSLLRIIREEGLQADAMSPGEILLLQTAGYRPEEILYVGNNVDDREFAAILAAGVPVSVDSLAQLERFGRLNPGGRVAVRINPGIGDGHHRKVMAAGAASKFGVYYTQAAEIAPIAGRYGLRIAGLNQHIGSNLLTEEVYLEAAARLLDVAAGFPDLEFVDFGGGFGIPYDGAGGRLDLKMLGARLSGMLEAWTDRYGRRIRAQVEPGRYIVAESGVLLVTVHARKENPGLNFIGTDGGFNVLARPVLYGSYHEIVNTSRAEAPPVLTANICGNVCEPGDLLGEDRPLPETEEGDVLAVLDAGAYGFSMASNYNARLRPAEVLLTEGGELRLIRKREGYEDLLRNLVY